MPTIKMGFCDWYIVKLIIFLTVRNIFIFKRIFLFIESVISVQVIPPFMYIRILKKRILIFLFIFYMLLGFRTKMYKKNRYTITLVYVCSSVTAISLVNYGMWNVQIGWIKKGYWLTYLYTINLSKIYFRKCRGAYSTERKTFLCISRKSFRTQKYIPRYYKISSKMQCQNMPPPSPLYFRMFVN